MNSDGEGASNVDSNLDSISRTRSCTFHISENFQELGLENTYNMPPCEDNQIVSQVRAGTAFEEPSLVDGASYTKLNSSRTSSVSIRDHQAQVDAVHPFFNGYRSVKLDKSTSTDNQVFYCRQCEINVELCQDAVNQHFISTQHTPIEEPCVYCNTAVYEYFYNDNVCYYHRCPNECQNQTPLNSTKSLNESVSHKHKPTD